MGLFKSARRPAKTDPADVLLRFLFPSPTRPKKPSTTYPKTSPYQISHHQWDDPRIEDWDKGAVTSMIVIMVIVIITMITILSLLSRVFYPRSIPSNKKTRKDKFFIGVIHKGGWESVQTRDRGWVWPRLNHPKKWRDRVRKIIQCGGLNIIGTSFKITNKILFPTSTTPPKKYYTDVPRCTENLTSVSEYLDKRSLNVEKSARDQRKHSFQVNLDLAYCIRVCQFWWYITCVLSKDVIRTIPPPKNWKNHPSQCFCQVHFAVVTTSSPFYHNTSSVTCPMKTQHWSWKVFLFTTVTIFTIHTDMNSRPFDLQNLKS
jgi:hypothetical protein